MATFFFFPSNLKPLPVFYKLQMSHFFQERATHVCLDCGYIYFLPKPFDEQVKNCIALYESVFALPVYISNQALYFPVFF